MDFRKNQWLVIFLSIVIMLGFVALSGVSSETSNEEIYLEKLTKLRPDLNNVKEYYDLGLWCQQNKLDTQAQTMFEIVIGFNPNHAGARQKLGYIKYKDKWIKKGDETKIDYEEKIANLKGDDVKGFYELGVWCKQKKLWAEAIKAFEKVIELSPNHTAAKNELNQEWAMQSKKQVAIWHRGGHSGFAVKTDKHFLIFDYSAGTRKMVQDEDGNLREDKELRPEEIEFIDEIKDENVLLFFSHEHPDHFNARSPSWQKSIKKIKYIVPTDELMPEIAAMGPHFKKDIKENLIELGAGQEATVDGITILTIKATDSGVGFLVKCDGLTIFHAGDHALWDKKIEKAYRTEIERLKGTKIDIAFLPLGPNHPNKETIVEGALWAVKELLPNVIVPMHLAGNSAAGESFVKLVQEQKLKTQAVCINKTEKTYFYNNGTIKEK